MWGRVIVIVIVSFRVRVRVSLILSILCNFHSMYSHPLILYINHSRFDFQNPSHLFDHPSVSFSQAAPAW